MKTGDNSFFPGFSKSIKNQKIFQFKNSRGFVDKVDLP